MTHAAIARAKLKGRQALHRALAAPAVYRDTSTPVDGLGITVRWHNKLVRNGAQEGGYDAEILEGIDRLVFQKSDLAVNAVELKTKGTVTVPFDDGSSAVFRLEAEEPEDGPENRYWSVSRL